MIYLDNAATTLRKPPCVIDAVVQAMQTMGNSGRSAHAESLAAARRRGQEGKDNQGFLSPLNSPNFP